MAHLDTQAVQVRHRRNVAARDVEARASASSWRAAYDGSVDEAATGALDGFAHRDGGLRCDGVAVGKGGPLAAVGPERVGHTVRQSEGLSRHQYGEDQVGLGDNFPQRLDLAKPRFAGQRPRPIAPPCQTRHDVQAAVSEDPADRAAHVAGAQYRDALDSHRALQGLIAPNHTRCRQSAQSAGQHYNALGRERSRSKETGVDKPLQPIRIMLDQPVLTRDDVRLSTDIYMPPDGGPFPTLLLRTIYDNQGDRGFDFIPRFVEAGYAVVMQDCRGRFDSGGEWEPYVHEAPDGYDTQEWIGAQPWCDGNIGAFGSSYIGFTQTQTAPHGSKFLKALVPSASQEDNYGHWYVDGALQLHAAMNFINMSGRTMQRAARGLMDSQELYRRLPLGTALDDIVDIPFYRDAIAHNSFDAHWRDYSMKGRYGDVDAPALFLTGWYDNLLHETFKLFTGWASAAGEPARSRTKLIVGPWDHGNIYSTETLGAVEFGDAPRLDMTAEHLRWYDRRLKGIENGIDDEQPIRLFVMGDNVWRHESEWPLARTQCTKFYLRSGGNAATLKGDGVLSRDAPADEPPDSFTYDPSDPVPTVGGQSMAIPEINAGPQDRRRVEERPDVLVFTSEPLSEEMEVTGPVRLNLLAASSVPDTDFTATLVDVHPDGRAIILCEGVLRGRFRDSFATPELMEPGTVYRFDIDMWETSNVFKPGHRVRVEVSSSNFPRFDRNLNTGRHPFDDAELRIAKQTVYHDAERASHITLPLVPR